MQHRFIKSLYVTATILSISACGSGGGGSGVYHSTDGDRINLSGSPLGKVTADTTYGNLQGQNNPNSFYGVWTENNSNRYELRYQGTPATNIPTTGKATYIGDAVWTTNGNDIRQGGSTTLNVDFGQKTVDGKIEFSPSNSDYSRYRDITLHRTTLNGSEFKGQASVPGYLLGWGAEKGTYEGGLFGRGATEAAGLVHFGETSDMNVSFGGKRR